jgi:hypothetical protein
VKYERSLNRDNLSIRDTERGHKFFGGRIAFGDREFEWFFYIGPLVISFLKEWR